jgi:hypothetical protein
VIAGNDMPRVLDRLNRTLRAIHVLLVLMLVTTGTHLGLVIVLVGC